MITPRSLLQTGFRLVLICLCHAGILSVARPTPDARSEHNNVINNNKQPATLIGVLSVAILAAILIVMTGNVYCLCTDCKGNGRYEI